MVQIPSNEIKQRLKEYRSKEISILIVEDHSVLRQGIRAILQEVFPKASVRIFKNFEEENIEEVIRCDKPSIITLDGRLDTWKVSHRVYKSFGMNLIPFILKESPDSIIVALSSESVTNVQGMLMGAHVSLVKDMLISFAEAIEAP